MCTVSVVVPTFNEVGLLARALQGVVDQTRQPEEVIVVDDRPGRNLRPFLGEQFPNVTYVPCERNVGAAEARNIGIRLASGDIIATLDDDDRYLPRFIERQVPSFEQHAEVVLSAADCVHHPVDGAAHYARGEKLPCFGSALLHCLRQGILLTMSQAMFRRDAAIAVGLLNPTLTIVHDHELYFKLMRIGSVAHVPECLVEKHEQPTSISRNVPLMVAELERMYESFIADPLNADLIPDPCEFRGDIWAGLAGTAILHGRCWKLGTSYFMRALKQHPRAAIRSVYRRVSAKLVYRIRRGRPLSPAA